MKIKSFCKINLFLHIIGKRKDGYHNLESLFYFPEVFDEIEIVEEKNPAQLLEIYGPFAEGLKGDIKNNIILKSYSLLKLFYHAKIPQIKFKLTKNIPISSGVGGGSANAAAVLNGLNDKFQLDLSKNQLKKFGSRLGADVPPCVINKPLFAEGIGDEITEIQEFPKLHILLVNPLIAVSTAEIFKMGFDRKSESRNLNSEKMSFKTTQNLIDFLENTKNDLEENATKLCPEIADIINNISAQSGCLLARMSGSGATCFGIFETKDRALMAQENILNKNPNYWAAVG